MGSSQWLEDTASLLLTTGILMTKIWCLATLTVATGLFVAAPAVAKPAAPEASGLLPLEARAMGAVTDGDNLEVVAEQINRSMGATDDSTETVMDLIDSSFLDGLVDENGEVKLPLGITVFNTMGDMSVGFGSDF